MEGLRWLASEPFRLFFFSGALWSIVGVTLWPLFYAGKLGFYPNFVHARLMIEAFGGAFVAGFLGTAGPRMASAPRLSLFELAGLFALHQAVAICHLLRLAVWGDALFAAMLFCLAGSLVFRLVRFGKEPPPPAMLLTLTGLISGVAGALLFSIPGTMADPARFRLAGLLLYQGFLLPPVLGIGTFLFPRILGGDFGEPKDPLENRRKTFRALTVAILLAVSFALEVLGQPKEGVVLRALVAAGYLLLEVRWRRGAGEAPRGSLAGGVIVSLGCGGIGLLAAGFFYPQHTSVEHLLYVGGFGLLMLLVASRVLFGHSGDLAGFARRSWFARFLVFLGILAATTRASTAFLPSLTVSHHVYAAITWALLAVLWLAWHRKRFLTRDPD